MEEYPYTSQLWAIEACRQQKKLQDIPFEWCQVITPSLDFWKAELATHPDNLFASWICNGFKHGFSIGFSSEAPELCSSHFNMLSASEHSQVVSEYIAKELSSQHLMLVNPSAMGNPTQGRIHISPLGVISKKGCPNCWRLIMDLSTPAGHSVNDGISRELCSLHYASLDDTAARVIGLG